MTTDDQRLLAALRQRDPDAFAALFEAYSDRLYRLAFSILNDEEEAEGVVQDAFLRLFERLDSFEGRSSPGTWLYRVAHNASLDRLRQRHPTIPLEDEPDFDEVAPFMPVVLTDWSLAPEVLLSSAEVRAELDAAIFSLPESLRSVFILREIEGLSTREVAEVLAISEGAVKVRLHRARLMLRERLASYFGERIAPSTE